MDAESGFILHRTVMLTAMASMLVVFGAYALHVTIETLRDHSVGMVLASRHPARVPTRPTPQLRRWRRRRR